MYEYMYRWLLYNKFTSTNFGRACFGDQDASWNKTMKDNNLFFEQELSQSQLYIETQSSWPYHTYIFDPLTQILGIHTQETNERNKNHCRITIKLYRIP